MLANFRHFFLRMTNSGSLPFSFLGIGLLLFASYHPSAWGQVSQNTFQSSGYLDTIQYRASLGETNLAFFEFSGSQETEDPLQDFFTYLVDPIN